MQLSKDKSGQGKNKFILKCPENCGQLKSVIQRETGLELRGST